MHQPGGALAHEILEGDAVDDVERVDDVALRLRHLLAFGVADQSVYIHLAEGHFARELDAHHDHAGDPKEDDVEARDEHRGRIEPLQRGDIVWPIERGERPERRGEPGVEHILVLAEWQILSETVASADLFDRTTDIDLSGIVVPRRDPMAPPELPTDAPVLDVAHPLKISARPVLRDETDRPVLNGLDRRRSERRDAHIPLIREVGLDDRTGAIATRHHELVRVDALEQTRDLEFGYDKLARIEAVEAPEAQGDIVVHTRIGREDIDAG